MFNIYIIDRETNARNIIEIATTETQAEKICDSWGWIYTDEKGVNYWLDYDNNCK